MKQGTWRALSIVLALLMAVAAVVAAAIGGCDMMIECTSGYMPMKCHWTFIAVTWIGAGGAVMALVGAFQKGAEGRRMAALAAAIAALVAIVVISPAGIGTCAHADSQCNMTAAIEYALCAVSIILGIVMVARADAEKAARPKQRL